MYGLADVAFRPLIKQELFGEKLDLNSFLIDMGFAIGGCFSISRYTGIVDDIVKGVAAGGNLKSAFDAAYDCTSVFDPTFPPSELDVLPIRSFDPNDKLGLDGAGPRKYIKGNEEFPYLIRFENKASASAAAQTVLIIDTLDTEKLDINTLELGYFSFDDKIVRIPPGRQNYTAEVDLRPSNNLIVRIEATLNKEEGILTWLYTSLDPRTFEKTLDPVAGFLPPNQTAPQGEGGVFFTIRPKGDLATNVSITNKAYIYFDNNEVIPTPPWTNSVDKSAPTSFVRPLEPTQPDTTFDVRWTGEDEGAGIQVYDIYVATNDGPYKPWLRQVVATSAPFTGEVDSTYHFYSVAIDSTGYTEAAPEQADATTKISLSTNVTDPWKNQIRVYPNPAHTFLTVELPQSLKESRFILNTLEGKQVLSAPSKGLRTDLDVRTLPTGIYMLQIENADITTVRRIVIQ
jgi:hypothetical protein